MLTPKTTYYEISSICLVSDFIFQTFINHLQQEIEKGEALKTRKKWKEKHLRLMPGNTRRSPDIDID